VGSRIRAYRLMRKMTLRQVAEHAEVSFSFLSQLERGASGVSVPTLRMIADALGLTLADLFTDEPAAPHRVLRKADRPRISTQSVDKYLLTRRPLQNLEVLEGVVHPGGTVGSRTHTHGNSQELLLVVAGSIRLILGDEEYALDAGDSIEYRSSVAHCVVNSTDEDVRVLWVISPPSL
jgi:transcriptional regulator with XRE-family HTH domain